MASIFKACNSPALIINGIPDHVHVLINLSQTITLAELMEQVKKSSSKWIKTKGSRYRHFYWQTGYGAFSVGYKNATIVKNYIKNQKNITKLNPMRMKCWDYWKDTKLNSTGIAFLIDLSHVCAITLLWSFKWVV